MRMRIDEPRHYNALTGVDNVCVAKILFDLITSADALDLAVADEHSAIANNPKLRHLRTNTRALWSAQRNNLRSVQNGESTHGPSNRWGDPVNTSTELALHNLVDSLEVRLRLCAHFFAFLGEHGLDVFVEQLTQINSHVHHCSPKTGTRGQRADSYSGNRRRISLPSQLRQQLVGLGSSLHHLQRGLDPMLCRFPNSRRARCFFFW